MFFFLSKTLGILLLPSHLMIGVGIAGLILLLTRFASLGRKLVVASLLLLVICGFSPIGNVLLYSLELRFPPWDEAHGAPDGIIVLGGAINIYISAAHGKPVFGPAIDRIDRSRRTRSALSESPYRIFRRQSPPVFRRHLDGG